ALGEVHPRYRTPALAILVMGLWSSLLVMLAAVMSRSEIPLIPVGPWSLNLNVPKDKSIFDILTDLAMFGAITFETLAVASIFMIRRKFPDVPRPYRCWGYPVVPALYVLVMALVFTNMFMSE